MQLNKKTMIISGFQPEGGGGGGVILRSILQELDSKKILWFSFTKDITINKNWNLNVKRFVPFFHIPGLSNSYINSFYKNFIKPIHYIFILINLKLFISKNKPALLWIIIDKDFIDLQLLITKLFKIDYHCSVHDDPEVLLKLAGLKYTKASAQLEHILKKAKSIDCICQGMVDYYNEKYKIDSFIITRTIDTNRTKVILENKKPKTNIIKIVLGGWGDCPKPWPENLIAALKLLEKNTSKKVLFYSFDPIFNNYVPNPNLIVVERMSNQKYEEFLEEIDLGYAPDPLSKDFSLFAKTSLSTKVLTYIANGIPYLYHGPEDSSVNDLNKVYKTGEILSSNEPYKIANAFESLLKNHELLSNNCLKLSQKMFDKKILLERLITHLNG